MPFRQAGKMSAECKTNIIGLKPQTRLKLPLVFFKNQVYCKVMIILSYQMHFTEQVVPTCYSSVTLASSI